jgi:hypothetical protein
MTRVVCQAGDGLTQPMVAGPSKGEGLRLAGCIGDGHGAGLCGEAIERWEASAHVAELGQDLSGADPAARGNDMMIWPSGSDSTKRSMRRVSSAI